MTTLMFPNSDALRLALAAELLPREVTGVAGVGTIDEHGQIWIGLSDGDSRSALAALTRIGVYRHGPGIAPTLKPIAAWAELLSLIVDSTPHHSQRSLLIVKDASLAKVVGMLQRRGGCVN